jgi:glutamate---cysteine ligase / carboxylate-amine ligase
MASDVAPRSDYCFGIEEEYFLADENTFQAPSKTPEALFEALEERTESRAGRESLQAQLEVCTTPSASVAEARKELRHIRIASAEAARAHGLAILASGTHPLARWPEMSPSSSERYFKVMDSLRMIGRRNMLCGMHVHVELPDSGRRVDVMTRLIPYLPLFIALSASSPFWQFRETGLMSYRAAAYDELPRSGIPELFASEEDYQRYVSALTGAAAIDDASFIWWLVRPSLKYPTLELRAPDVCTRLDDAIAIACLYRALARHLFRMREKNLGLTAVDRAIAVENKWIAQRYGVHGTFAGRDRPKTVGELLDEVVEMTAEDAMALGCLAEIEHCRVIIAGGTSACRQLCVARERKHEGSEAALKSVARWIAEETLAC